MPKGVPPEVVRALRLGRKKPGQFLTYETAFRLRDALRTFYAPAPKRKAPKKKPKKAAPKVERRVFEIEEPEPKRAPEAGAVEWEVGVSYSAAVRTSNVAFNARFYRRDGRKMTEADARAVLRHIVYHGQAPDDIEVREVWWARRKDARRRYGRTKDMTAFYDILGAVGDDGMTTTPLRLGAVKPDRL